MRDLMESVNLGSLHKKVAQLCSGKVDEWVCAYVGSIYSTRGSYTYVGCSKFVHGGATNNHWLCRKKLSANDNFPEECLNHNYKHEGKCCSIEAGIKCFRFAVRLVDESGELEALIWAPAIHLLECKPNEFDAMTVAQKEAIFHRLQGREWRFNILSVVDELGFRQFKIQFLMPSDRAYELKQPRALSDLKDLPTGRIANLPANISSNGPDCSKTFAASCQRRSNNPLILQPKVSANATEANDKGSIGVEITEKDFVSSLNSSSQSSVTSVADQKEVLSSQAHLQHIKLSLESMVAASQKHAKDIEQLALAVAEFENQNETHSRRP